MGIGIPLIGIGLLSSQIHNSKCIIESIGHRNCYEQKAQIILEQYITINGNKSAFIYCGPVLQCETSPCDIKVAIGLQYWCYSYNDNGLYQLTEFSETNGLRLYWICICALILVIVIIASIIFFFKILPTTPISYDRIDDVDVPMKQNEINIWKLL